MKKKIISLLFAALILLGCQAPAPPALEQQSNEVQKQDTGSTQSKVWPYVSDKQKDVALAANLIAKNFVVVLDGSGSMDSSRCSGSSKKIDVAKNSIVEWTRAIPSGSNLGLVAFHRKWTTMDITSKDQSINSFATTISGVDANGNTPLATAMKLAYGMLTKQAQRQLGYGEYTIVVVTDGEDNDESESLKKWVDLILRDSPIRIFTIGFCIEGGHYLNQPKRTIYREANNPAALKTALQEVLAEAESFDAKGFK